MNRNAPERGAIPRQCASEASALHQSFKRQQPSQKPRSSGEKTTAANRFDVLARVLSMANILGWLPKSLSRQLVVLRSVPISANFHFVSSDGRSARCPGEGCLLCGVWDLKQHALCVVSPMGSSNIYVLELTKAHLDLRMQLANLGAGCVGSVLQITSVKGARNEPLDVRFVDQVDATSVPCERYLSAIGRREYQKVATCMKLSL